MEKLINILLNINKEVKNKKEVNSMAKETKAQDNVVFVGNKPPMSYVLAAVTQFSDGQNKIQIKARGRAIWRAVDVAEIVRNRFVKDVKVGKVEIGTDEIENEDGGKVNVSTIQIELVK